MTCLVLFMVMEEAKTCPRRKSMQEDKNAGKKVKGTGKKGEGIGKYVLGKLQTLVYFKRP